MADEAPRDDIFEERTDLIRVDQDIWQLLVQAVSDRSCGWRLPVVASRSGRGVRQRTVVLRGVDPVRRTLLIHTDARSPKVGQMEVDDRVSVLFYDSTRAVQLSVTATASIHRSDQTAEQLWNNSHPLSLKYCLGPDAPGTESAVPTVNLPEEWRSAEPSRTDLEQARENFAAIEFSVRRIDWLSLSRDGNLRAVFEYTPEHPETVARQWLAP
jgi:pyridoxamine 5'-phosphate oxidase